MADVEFTVALDGSVIKKQIKELPDQFEKAGKESGESFSDKFKKGITGGQGLQTAIGTFAGNIAFQLGSKLFSAIKDTVGSAIGEAIQAEENINKLNQSLVNAGRFSAAASDGLREFADSMAATTKLSDDEVVSLLSLAQNYARTTEQSQKLTEAAIQLAAATGKDVNTALDFLGKNLQGIKGKLGASVVGFDQLTESQLRAGKGIDLVLGKFSGTAQAQLTTFGGVINQVSKNWTEFLEALGTLITKIPGLKGAFEQLALVTKFWGDQLKSAVNTSAAERIKEIGIEIDRLNKQESFTERWLKGLTELEKTEAIGVIRGKVSLLNEELKKLQGTGNKLSEDGVLDDKKFKADAIALDAALSAANTSMAQSLMSRSLLIQDAGLRDSGIIAASDALRLEAINEFEAKKAAISAQFEGAEGANILRRNELLIALEQQKQDRILAIENDLQLKRKTVVQNGFTSLISVAGQATEIIINTNNLMASALSSGFAKVGEALVKGENAFKSFGESILASIGGFLISLGQQLILVGLGMEAFKLALNSLNGFAAIAAGAALIVAGSAFQAIAGQGAKGGFAGGAATGGAPAQQTTAEIPETEQKTTAVNINVEGTVLNPREVGMQIAQILSDTFDSNDTRIVASA